MRRLLCTAVLAALAALALTRPAAAEDRAGDFAYYLLALSWSPSWCVAEGDARGAEACAPGGGRGFTLHGIWPQHEEGWPEYCATPAREPSRRETAAMADLYGSAGLAWHQWRKHGRCSGKDPADYFVMARRAVSLIALPELAAGQTTAAEVEAAFRRRNPDVPGDAALVTCREGRIAEVRICLTRDLAPRGCGADVLARACPDDRTLELPPVR